MNRRLQPPFQKSLTFNLPIPERVPLAQSRELFYLPSNVGEAVKVEFIFKAGRYFEHKPGTAQFLVNMLDKGVPGKDANQISNLLDYYGAHLEVQAGFDFASVTLYTLRKNVKHLLPLFLSLVSAPEFPEKELTNYRKIFIENLKVNLEKNSFVASNHIRKSIFGSHPYGGSIQIEDAEKIVVSDLKKLFKDHFRPFKIFVIGTLDRDDLEYLAKSLDDSLKRNVNEKGSVDGQSPTTEVIQGPNKIQASLKLGRKTIPRDHLDLPGVQLINHLLGGFFGSRLMKNIREEKGLTYGIHSSIHSMQEASSLIISADVNADKSEIALQEIQKELRQLNTISESELDIARNHLIGSLQNDITTVFAAGERIKIILLSNLSTDYYQNLINQINEIQIQKLKEVCNTYFNPEEFSVVVVK